MSPIHRPHMASREEAMVAGKIRKHGEGLEYLKMLTLNPLDLRRPRAFSNLRPLERTYGLTPSWVCKLFTLTVEHIR